MPEGQRQPAAEALTLLCEGEVELQGRMPWSSNQTFLVTLHRGDEEMAAVYKPHRGERPLWDFPDGLYQREAAAWVVSEALGWGIVPETVVRADGPLGPGSFQRFVPADFGQHYFTLLEDERHHDALRVIAAFDLVVNNADRKSGHCLLGEDGRILAIDHGLCFHADPKVRTVMWDFAGQPVPPGLRADLERLAGDVPGALYGLLSEREVAMVARRAAAVASEGLFPEPPPTYRAYPWPLV